MFIKSVKQANVKGYLKLEIDTGEGIARILLSDGQYDALGRPTPCEEISDEDFRFAMRGDEYNGAKKKALNILSFGDNSESALSLKLARAGFSREVRETVVSEMKALGYIDEERQIARLIETEASVKLRGPKKIIAQLSAKGYPADKIKETLRRLEIEKIIDFSEIKQKLIADVSDEEQRRKILYKSGF